MSDNPHLFPFFQPWEIAAQPFLTPDQLLERRELLADLANSRLGKMEQKVAFILQRYPETRDSDTALCIRYWKRFQADILEQWSQPDLDILYDLDKIETIARIGRHIRNTLRLYTSTARAQQLRDARQMEMYQYLAAHQNTASEIRFYLDETGNDPNKVYTGVAGLCVMEYKQYEKHHAALIKWRNRQAPETIRFTDTGSTDQPRAIALLHELNRRRHGLLFAGYAISKRARAQEMLAGIYCHLVMDCVRHMEGLGCLTDAKSILLVKEADSGWDSMYVPWMEKALAEQLATEYPGRVFLKTIQPLPKGREPLLECADLIAGGMQRRALMGGISPKDKLAETVFNVTGFEDPRDNGTTFKSH